MDDARERVRLEFDELGARLKALESFLNAGRPVWMGLTAWRLLRIQRSAMAGYLHVLGLRLDLWDDAEPPTSD